MSFVVGSDHTGGEFDQFRHGYAGTIYKGQGRTLDTTYLYHSEHWRSRSSYVALTRHREDVKLFVATKTARDLGQLARQMARIDDTRSASEFYVVDEPPSAPRPSILAERRSRMADVLARRDQRRDESSGGGRSGAAADDYRELREAREAVEEARRREAVDRSRDRERDRGGRSR